MEEKKYVCTQCNEMFTKSIDLASHVRDKHKEKRKKKRIKKSDALISIGILRAMTTLKLVEISEKEIANDAINTIERFITESTYYK